MRTTLIWAALALAACAGPDQAMNASDGGAADAGADAAPRDAAARDGSADLAPRDAAPGDAAAQCDPARKVIGGGGGPDICPYGTTCSQARTCAPVPVGACQEATGLPVWNQTSKLAPVIVSATATALASTNASTECANGDPAALVTIDFYAPNGLTTHTMNAFADLSMNHAKFKVSTSSTGSFFGVNFPRMNPPANMVFGSMQVGIGCGRPTGTAAMFIADETGLTSNIVCVSW